MTVTSQEASTRLPSASVAVAVTIACPGVRPVIFPSSTLTTSGAELLQLTVVREVSGVTDASSVLLSPWSRSTFVSDKVTSVTASFALWITTGNSMDFPLTVMVNVPVPALIPLIL